MMATTTSQGPAQFFWRAASPHATRGWPNDASGVLQKCAAGVVEGVDLQIRSFVVNQNYLDIACLSRRLSNAQVGTAACMAWCSDTATNVTDGSKDAFDIVAGNVEKRWSYRVCRTLWMGLLLAVDVVHDLGPLP